MEFFEKENQLIEMQRIQQRTMYDLEMIKEVGYLQRDRKLLAPL